MAFLSIHVILVYVSTCGGSHAETLPKASHMSITGCTYIVPVRSTHLECSTPAMAYVVEVAVTDDVVESVAA